MLVDLYSFAKPCFFARRSLVKKDFARLGKWFVQPFDGPDKALNKSTHLSFSFHYFIHGESSVCASIDVRQHPPVRRLSMHHVNAAKGQVVPAVPVILAPYGLAATLTGVTYGSKCSDANVNKLLKEWNGFYPLDRNRYFSQDGHGGIVEMPVAVEVMLAGVRMTYPSCYVLVTDIDETPPGFGAGTSAAGVAAGGQHTFRNCGSGESNNEIFHVEHSPYTASNHALLGDGSALANDLGGARGVCERTEAVWQDSICFNPEAAASAAATSEQQPGGASQIMEYLAHWDFCNPGKTTKKRHKIRTSSRESKSRDRSRFSSKIPFHRKAEVVDDLAWTFGQTMMIGGGAGGGGSGGGAAATNGGSGATGSNGTNGGTGSGSNGGRSGQMGPPGSVKGISSPASVGPTTPLGAMTPKGSPSVKTPGDPNLGSLMSPHPPPSNGPLTPADGGGDHKPPRTPKSVPQYSAAASPFTNVRSVESNVKKVKQEDGVEAMTPAAAADGGGGQQQQQGDENKAEASSSSAAYNGSSVVAAANRPPVPSVSFKRPALPQKEYEEVLEREDVLSDNVYDHEMLHNWLNYPVKKFRKTDSRKGDPFRPMYRRQSQGNVFEAQEVATAAVAIPSEHPKSAAEEKVNGVDIKEEHPDVNGLEGRQRSRGEGDGHNVTSGNNSDPYEFNDEKKDGKVGSMILCRYSVYLPF